MTPREAPDGTPSEQQVEQDFTVPGDADLRPAQEDADGDPVEDEDAS